MFDSRRNNVLCIGSIEISSKAFENRGLNLVNVSLENAEKGFNEARAIIIAEPMIKMGVVRECFSTLKMAVAESGLLFAVIVENQVQPHSKLISTIWNDVEMDGELKTFPLQAVENAAQAIYDFFPGPPIGNPQIIPNGFTVNREVQMILRRAFYDCERVYMRRIYGGEDSLGVFCVDAWLKRSIVGPRPLPFFVKISEKEKIERERRNYTHYAEFFIPFYLRPNLDTKRCVTIGKLGSIVGNFVEDSQPLRSALRANPGPGILFSLFETSLRGFRLQPHAPSAGHEVSLADFVQHRACADTIPKAVVKRARKLGLRLTPTVLEMELRKKIGERKFMASPYHGDLHSGNVMVRGKDAILIDFSAVRDGPISADVAAIEVSLVFGTDAFDNTRFCSWKEFVDDIYHPDSLHQPPSAEETPDSYSWLRKTVREIYHIALGCDCTQEERKAVLAAYLIRFARLKSEKFENKHLSKLALYRHAYALVVAERITQTLFFSNEIASR